MRNFKRLHANHPEVAALEANVRDTLEPLLRRELLDGRLIEDAALTTGTGNDLLHKLGRVPKGWIVVKQNAQADVWENANATPAKVLTLQTSANVTVSLWVF